MQCQRTSQRTFVATCVVTTCTLCRKLTVRECDLQHNHCVSPEIFAHYPANRRLNKKEEDNIVEILHLQPNNKRVCEMIQKNVGKLVTLKDISNLKMKVKANM